MSNGLRETDCTDLEGLNNVPSSGVGELGGNGSRLYLLEDVCIGFGWHISRNVAVTLQVGIEQLETAVIFQIPETHVVDGAATDRISAPRCGRTRKDYFGFVSGRR